MSFFVTKKDGRKESYHVDKIKKVIQWATTNLDVNPLILESKFDSFLFDGISTVEIQQNLIYHSRILSNPSEPEWSVVAGRLETMLLWSETNIHEKTFIFFIREMESKGLYKHPALKKYTKTEVNTLSDFIVQERDLAHSYGSVLTANAKYLMKGECIQQMFMVNAMIIASAEPKENRLDYVKEIYDALSLRKLSLATPWLSNLRANNNISSCFIMSIDDSIESIFDNVKNAALISKMGGGLGIDMARIRAKGASIDGNPDASKGITSWAKIFNDTAVSVDQCFHPNTKLITEKGVKCISELIPNTDKVLNGSGKFSKVVRKKNYSQQADMIELKTKYSIHPEFLTVAHPIYAITNIKKGVSFNNIPVSVKESASFKDSGDLKVGDFVGSVIPTNVIDDGTISEDLCRFYGIMLGDGHITKKTHEYGISFHETNDHEHYLFVKEFLADNGVYFWESKPSPNKKYKQIRWSKTGEKNENRIRNDEGKFVASDKLNFPEILREHLYDKNGKKRIHEKFLHLSPLKQLQIVKGLVETDGGIYRNNEVNFYNTSSSLVEGLRYILLRNKILCSGELISKTTKMIPKESNCYIIRIPALDIIANLFNITPTNKPHWFEHNGYLFNRITNIKPFEYDGDVYDLEVSNFPSYQISSFMCHNGGKRAGAFTLHTPIWHRDIEDFIEIQAENGDLRKKSFDIFPQVGIYDAYMKEVLKDNGGIWYTFCPHEVREALDIELYNVFGRDFSSSYKRCVSAYKSKQLKNVGVYNAKELLKEIMKVQFESGLPYITFLDRLNEQNPNSHDGYVKYYIGNKEHVHYNYDQVELKDGTFVNAIEIVESLPLKIGIPERLINIPFNIPCFNLCTESTSNVVPDDMYHACNLLSLVLGRIFSDEEMIKLARLASKILDSGIELTNPPIKETAKHNNRYRTVGIGIQGLHDYMAYHNIQWTDYKAITKVAELIEFGAVQQSIVNAKLKGAFPAFKGSKWDTGEMIERFKKHSVTDLPWDALQADINAYGIRNSQNTSPAPNTSSAIFMDAGAGALPVYSGYHNEDNTTGKFAVYGMYIKEKPLAYERTQPRMNQAELTKVVGALQNFVDTGISAEYCFDQNMDNFSAKMLYDLIVASWKNKNKAIYYIRSIKKGETLDDVLHIESVCAGCTG